MRKNEKPTRRGSGLMHAHQEFGSEPPGTEDVLSRGVSLRAKRIVPRFLGSPWVLLRGAQNSLHGTQPPAGCAFLGGGDWHAFLHAGFLPGERGKNALAPANGAGSHPRQARAGGGRFQHIFPPFAHSRKKCVTKSVPIASCGRRSPSERKLFCAPLSDRVFGHAQASVALAPILPFRWNLAAASGV